MDNNKNKPSSKSRQKQSKAPPQIANFFAQPLSPNNQRLPSSSQISPNDRKRKLSEQETTSQNENPSTYAKTLERDAAKISNIPKAKKTSTVVSTFFQQNSDDHSDFESPSKKIQFKTPPVIPKKRVTRKRKPVGKQSKFKEALETEVFENVLRQYSNDNDMNPDDVQLSIALSRSLTDTHGCNGSESSELSNISSIIRNAEPLEKEDIVRQTFQKFGFKKRDNTDYDYRDFFGYFGSKRKWSSKFTPLTHRSEHFQKEKFKNKVKGVLKLCEAFDGVNTEATREYNITSSYLHQFFIPNSPAYNISIAATKTNIEEFYVNDLVPISKLRCGCLLKNWADIPGRDVSPPRSISGSSNVNDVAITQETLTEEKRDENDVSPNCKTDNIVETRSCKDDNYDIPESLMDVDYQPETLHADERSYEDMETAIHIQNEREPSPDMFADCDSSANSSLNDGKQNAEDCSIISKDCPYESSLDKNEENNDSPKPPHVLPVEHQDDVNAIDLSSDESDQGCANISQDVNKGSPPEFISISSTNLKQLSFTDRLEMYNRDPALGTSDDDHISSHLDQLSQDSIVISDDEINYSINPCGGSGADNNIDHHAMLSQESIVLPDSEDEERVSRPQSMNDEAEERQSFASIELENGCDFDGGNGVDLENEVFDSKQSSQNDDRLSRSVRQLCQKESSFASVNSPKETNFYSIKSPSVGVASQESIVLSDSDDDNVTPTQVNQSEVAERQSFASIDLEHDYNADDEHGPDINIDDEIYNSNQSLNDEDLINLSVREMYQKEFVAESAKSSAKKSFLRTTSDLSFERKQWKPAKTPDKLHNFSDDDFDEFDALVRGPRYPRSPMPNVNSIEISDDERDESPNVQRNNTHRDDSSLSNLPKSPTVECDDFIVQSMDQIYQVRTGKLVSPKPNYQEMDSPTRLKHLRKYGLKVLSKRKAVICLEHIYNRLHPYIELDERDDLDNILSQKGKVATDSSNNRTDVMAVPLETSKSLAENHFDALQENEDIFYLPSAPRAKNPWCLEPLHIAWHNLINSNASLYDDILQYKPIDLMDIRSLLKSIGLRYETNDIISFLDRKCITFKTDNKRNVATKKS